MLFLLKPRALRIEARPAEKAADLLRRIDDAVAPFPRHVFMHIDLTDQTKVPAQRDALTRTLRRRGAAVWNASLPDFSKQSVQKWNRALRLPSTVASKHGPPEELLIVKTRFNCFAATECQLSPEDRVALGYRRRWSTPIDGLDDYPVMKRAAIPSRWWSSPELMIERFVSSSRGDSFRVLFAGRNVVLFHFRSRARLKTPANAFFSKAYLLQRRPETIGHCARLLAGHLRAAFESTVRFAAALDLDFGAIDLVADRDRVYIVDVNPTAWGGMVQPEEIRAHLRDGLRGWIPRAAPGRGHRMTLA